jgi:hypothetical protein
MTETASHPARPGGCNCGEIRYVVTRPFLTAYAPLLTAWQRNYRPE